MAMENDIVGSNTFGKVMEPNEAFWRFVAEIQPTDIAAICFSEGMDLSHRVELSQSFTDE